MNKRIIAVLFILFFFSVLSLVNVYAIDDSIEESDLNINNEESSIESSNELENNKSNDILNDENESDFSVDEINDSDILINTDSNIIDKRNTESVIGKGLHPEEDGIYYYDDKGNKLTGFVRDEYDNLYYFDEKTAKMCTGWIEVNGNIYYADLETGILKRLISEIDGKSYFFGRTGGALQKGVINFYDDIYLTDSEGVLQKGIKTINNIAYYFGEDYKAASGWIEYSGEKYYADINTKQLYNLIHEVDGELYFFGRTQYRVLKGWINYNGTVYYADLETGALKRLINEVDGKSYFFGRTGASLQKGLIEYYGDYYLTDDKGVLQKGIKNDNNKGYYFGDDYKAVAGWIDYNGEKYYADMTTKQLYNLIHEVEGYAYFFGRTQYRVLKGWINYNGTVYYADLETGILVSGIKTIDGIEYNFDSGYKLQSGWQTINGQKYYLYSNMSYAIGIQTIGGKRYMFNSNGVLMYSDVKVYIDISSHQGDIDFDALWNSGRIDGIILRAGYWDSEDKYFKYYIQEIKRLGIPYTVYLYSYAHDGLEALVEAQNMVNILRKYDLHPSLNVYYDIEGYDTGVQDSDDISKEEYQRIALNFINYLNQNGYGAKIYSYYYFALNRFDETTRNQLDWIAKYTSTNNYPYNWRGWQFTDCESVPGISGNVDMSIFLY